jgi:hypothetical protein
MIPRTAEQTVKRLDLGFPIVAITGPRQAGKTTLASDWYAALRCWQSFAGEETLTPLLIYGGDAVHQREGVEVMGWKSLAES